MAREWVTVCGAADRFERFDFSGFSAGNTFRGKLYITWLSEVLRCYKSPALTTADLVCVGSATTAQTTINLTSNAASGINGTVYWKAAGDGDIGTDAPAQLLVSYAFSADMLALSRHVTAFLPIAGRSDFKDQLVLAKWDVDQIVRRRWGPEFDIDPHTQRPDFRDLADVTELADAQAYRALYWVHRHKANSATPDDDHYANAQDWAREYDREVGSMTLQIDKDSDGLIEREPARVGRLRRR